MKRGRYSSLHSRIDNHDASITVQSVLVRYIMLQMVGGRISQSQAHHMGKLFKKDIEQFILNPNVLMPDVDALASVNGPNWYDRFNFKLPPLTSFQIPVKNASVRTYEFILQFFSLPHVALAHMYNECRTHFNDIVCGGRDALYNFWHSQIGNPQFECLSMRSLRDLWGKTVPIAIHGDAVPCVGVGKSWGKKFDIFVMGICVG